MGLMVFGECLFYYENKVILNYEVCDIYGQFILMIDCEFKENENKMWGDMMIVVVEMLEVVGFKDVQIYDCKFWFGLGIYEMGIVRMGCDLKIFVLNKWN